jgi:hypothetical protein
VLVGEVDPAFRLALALAFLPFHAALPGVLISTGAVGGFVGIQRRLKELTAGDLELLADSWLHICLSPFVGGILALLMYLLFLADLLAGGLFPKFVTDDTTVHTFESIFYQHGVTFQDYAKLLFWSFVAGYSEHFVTDVISRFEGTAIKSLPSGGGKDSGLVDEPK